MLTRQRSKRQMLRSWIPRPWQPSKLRMPNSSSRSRHSNPQKTQAPLANKSAVAQDRVGVLVVLAVVALVASVSVSWVKTTIQNEDQFVATLEPLSQEEAVASVIALRVADAIVEAGDVEVWVAGNLPDGLKFLSVPVTESITAVIAGAANEVIVVRCIRFGLVGRASGDPQGGERGHLRQRRRT